MGNEVQELQNWNCSEKGHRTVPIDNYNGEAGRNVNSCIVCPHIEDR